MDKQINNIENQRRSSLLDCIIKWSQENNKTTFRAIEIPCLQKSRSFLSKHCVKNPGGYTVYFERKGRGVYKLIEKNVKG